MKRSLVLLTFAVLAFSACKKAAVAKEETKEPLSASFRVNNAGGEVSEGATLLVSNNSTGSATYLWDFGNGKISTDKEPSCIYAHCGIYTVKLTVADAKGNTATVSKELYVTCVFGNANHAPLF